MYLAQLNISNFRKLKEVQIQFQPGLNIVVGANNVGKTAVVDALRALHTGHDELPLRLDIPRSMGVSCGATRLRTTTVRS